MASFIGELQTRRCFLGEGTAIAGQPRWVASTSVGTVDPSLVEYVLRFVPFPQRTTDARVPCAVVPGGEQTRIAFTNVNASTPLTALWYLLSFVDGALPLNSADPACAHLHDSDTELTTNATNFSRRYRELAARSGAMFEQSESTQHACSHAEKAGLLAQVLSTVPLSADHAAQISKSMHRRNTQFNAATTTEMVAFGIAELYIDEDNQQVVCTCEGETYCVFNTNNDGLRWCKQQGVHDEAGIAFDLAEKHLAITPGWTAHCSVEPQPQTEAPSVIACLKEVIEAETDGWPPRLALGTTLQNDRRWRSDMAKLLDEVEAGTRKSLHAISDATQTQSFASALLLLANISPLAIGYITAAIDASQHMDTHAADDANRLLRSHSLTHKCTTLAPGLPCFLRGVVIVARLLATASHCNPADVDNMDRATLEREVTQRFNLGAGHTTDVPRLPYGAHILYDEFSIVIGTGLPLIECFRPLKHTTPAIDARLWTVVHKQGPQREMAAFGAHLMTVTAVYDKEMGSEDTEDTEDDDTSVLSHVVGPMAAVGAKAKPTDIIPATIAEAKTVSRTFLTPTHPKVCLKCTNEALDAIKVLTDTVNVALCLSRDVEQFSTAATTALNISFTEWGGVQVTKATGGQAGNARLYDAAIESPVRPVIFAMAENLRCNCQPSEESLCPDRPLSYLDFHTRMVLQQVRLSHCIALHCIGNTHTHTHTHTHTA